MIRGQLSDLGRDIMAKDDNVHEDGSSGRPDEASLRVQPPEQLPDQSTTFGGDQLFTPPSVVLPDLSGLGVDSVIPSALGVFRAPPQTPQSTDLATTGMARESSIWM